MVDVGILVAAGVAPTQARLFALALATACQKWGIADSPTRLAMFLAQAMHESNCFRDLEEDLFYRDPLRVCKLFSAFDANHDRINQPEEVAAAGAYVGQPQRLANKVYANRMGNGNEASGDGWKFRGRGIFQLTGRDNYHRAAMGTGRPYESIPELVCIPQDACVTAAWFWTVTSCNKLADSGDFDAVTRKINPAMAGATSRRKFYSQARAALALPLP
jgi:putative chitinase